MQVWGAVRRLGLDRVTTAAGVVAVTLSLIVVAAGPIYAEAVTLAALRERLADEPVRASTITIESALPGDSYDLLDRIVVSAVGRATSSTGAETTRSAASESYEYTAASDELVALAVLRSMEGVDDHATLAAGDWPTDGSAGGGQADIAVDARNAIALGLEVGDAIALTVRQDPSRRLTATVTGIYEVDDPTEPIWAAQPALLDGVGESTRFRTWSFVTTRETVLGATTPRIDVGWFVQPDLTTVSVGAIETLGRGTARLEADLSRGVDTARDDGAQFSDPEIDTGLPAALADADRSLEVTRSGVLAVTLQLAVLAGYALALIAGLLAEIRRTELDVLRARGASPFQLLRRSTAEALLLTVPAAVAAPWLAAAATGFLSSVGPLARNNLTIDPRPIASANVAVAVAAVVTVGLLALPTFRLARTAQRDADARRERTVSTMQRAGLDLAIVVLAGVAIWQLATLGEARTAEIRGRFGVDPLLVVAPALGLFAGAFLALRVVPGLAKLAELALARTRSAVVALAGWQVARRPTRYARTALLLIMGVALGVFTTTYESTWERSQIEQGDHRAGAEVRVEPNRRVNDSIEDLHLLAAYRRVEGVEATLPAVRRSGELPNSDRPAMIIGLDATRAPEVVLAADHRERLDAAFDRLAAERPTLPAITMPEQTETLEIELTATDITPDDGEPGPVEPAIDAQVFVVLRDGDDLLHRRRAGRLVDGDGPTVMSIPFTADGPADLVPTPPMALVDIELRVEVPSDANRTARVVLTELEAIDGAGGRAEIGTDRWSFRTAIVGALDDRIALGASEEETDGLVAVDIATGRSRFGAFVTYGIGPSGTAPPTRLPVVVSRSWFDANRREIGDTAPLAGLADRTGRIVGTVTAFPTVSPDDADVVLLDLATLQTVSYELGQPILEIGEVWLSIGADASDVGERLTEHPYDATSVVVRNDVVDRLLADPPAVGTIGVLTIGFVAAAAFAVIGFLVAATVSARERAGEFALLRALGLSSRQLAGWTMLEQAALIVLSLVLGTVIGIGLAAVLLPSVSLTTGGEDVFPPVEVVHPWGAIVSVQLVVLSALAVAVLGITTVLRRLAIARQLRTGSS